MYGFFAFGDLLPVDNVVLFEAIILGDYDNVQS